MGDDDMKELKSLLRSLVVSSPTQMDVRSLLRDYRNMVGAPVPLTKYGHRDPVAFLKERCSDCFVLTGSPSNPILTLIVPDSLKHIDQFVQRQRVPSTAKFKSKRRSVPEAVVNPPKRDQIYKTFIKKDTPPVAEKPKQPEVKAPDIKQVNHNKENVQNHNSTVTSTDVKNFLKKRLPAYNSLYNFEEEDGTMSLQDDDSGKHTSSTSNSTKALQFEELKSEIMELISAAPEGVWCTDLIRLYRERYGRELNFTRFGYTSIISLLYVLEARVHICRPVDTGDWLLTSRARAAPAPHTSRARAAPAPHTLRARRSAPLAAAAPAPAPDPDDALPGIEFDPDVFPEDCVRFMEQIPALSLADCRPGAMLEVMVGEVYSPSHFWLIRLGDNYNIAMEEMMDEMTQYYNGEGRARSLARGAIRVGHYCSTLYENDWHRSLIVKIVDSDTVKVRHVDYGTVETVSCCALRPLRRQWARLPAQALRARLAGLRPSAAGRRWPHAAAQHFLRLVSNARLVANVVAVDTEHDVLETLLIDTRGATDLCLTSELIRAGHADARADSALRAAECYLYPRFEALEAGDTPNLAEIHAYLRDGIALDYVEAYRLHVPMCLPAPTPARPAAPPAPAPAPPAPAPVSPDSGELATRIPLLWPSAFTPPVTEIISLTQDNSFSTPSLRSSPSPPLGSSQSPPPRASPSPSPLPEHSPPTSVPEKAQATPPRDFRPPSVPVKPSFHSQPEMNPHRTVHPQPVFNSQPAFHPQPAFRPPPNMHPQHAFPPRPAPPPPLFALPPAPPPGPWFACAAPGMVALSLAECDTYRMLANVNPEAAHWYMAGALGRAMGAPRGPYPGPPHGPHHGPVRAPPGFGG